MNKLLVIFTGGTIGSHIMADHIDVDASMSFKLLKLYEQAVADGQAKYVQFDTIQAMNLLSENVIPSDWHQLIEVLNEIELTQYDGIIMTHGSDTLAYSAAAISYAFAHTSVPIVLVASGYPLEDPRSNGLNNFISAVNLITETQLPGVFVSYENSERESVIYLGTRIIQATHFTDQFSSPYEVPFGWMLDGKLVRNEHPLNPTLDQLKATRTSVVKPQDMRFSDEILYIKPFPCMDYRYYDFSRVKPKVILHDLYHSGTANTRFSEEAMYSLLSFSDYCRSHEVDLYIAPIKSKTEGVYSSLAELLAAGVTAFENISIEAAKVKLMLAYGTLQSEKEIRSFLRENIFFETCE